MTLRCIASASFLKIASALFFPLVSQALDPHNRIATHTLHFPFWVFMLNEDNRTFQFCSVQLSTAGGPHRNNYGITALGFLDVNKYMDGD